MRLSAGNATKNRKNILALVGIEPRFLGRPACYVVIVPAKIYIYIYIYIMEERHNERTHEIIM